jgi:hypothetical protein
LARVGVGVVARRVQEELISSDFESRLTHASPTGLTINPSKRTIGQVRERRESI